MNNMELKAAYESLILPHHRLPFQFFSNEKANTIVKAYNPLCGDKFTIYLEIKDKRILMASFDGIGCALSRASLSILINKITNQKVSDVLEKCKHFLGAIASIDADSMSDTALKILVELVKQEGRTSCIILGWTALHDHLIKPLNQS